MQSSVLLSPTLLSQWYAAQRQHTHCYLKQLSGADWVGAEHPALNPPIWEWLHINWFAEFWCLRQHSNQPLARSWLEAADERFNSALLSHENRWRIDYPALDVCWHYDAIIAEQVTAAIRDGDCDGYFGQLALHHEAMHEENFMRRAQRLAQSFRQRPSSHLNEHEAEQSIAVPSGVVTQGQRPSSVFAFDNEHGECTVPVAAFILSKTPVTEMQFATFVAAGGYADPRWWSAEGWQWRLRKRATQPMYWQRHGERWWIQDFDQQREPNACLPMRYVNAYEAEAYCTYLGARLPSAAEWLHAYTQLLILPMWEWTADVFAPYPGFSPGPYTEYSTASFGVTRELRGHSPLLHTQLCRPDFRNFFAEQRRDVCAGFRTCVSAR